jgi:transcriptional regulator with XRE-family HTH domain
MTDRRIKPKSGCLSGRALLAQWLVRHRMTQAEAADQIGISRVKLNQYLTGVARPSLETAIRIEDVTGIGVRLWLTAGEEIAQETQRQEESEVNIIFANGHKPGVEQ